MKTKVHVHPVMAAGFIAFQYLLEVNQTPFFMNSKAIIGTLLFTGRFWMDNVYCDGTELEITSCRFEGWGYSDCDASEAAGVICMEENLQNTELQKIEQKRRQPKL